MGMDRDRVMDMIPGGENALTNPVKRFHNQVLIDILNHSVEQTGDRSIGLRIGLNFRMEHFLDVGYALPYARNLREAIEVNMAHQPLTQQIGRTSVRTKDGYAIMGWTSNAGETDYESLYVESIFAGYASIGRWLLFAQDNPIVWMQFKHHAPKDMSTHNLVFGEDIRFGADKDELVFKEELLDAPMPMSNPDMFALLKTKLSRKLIDLNQPTPVALEATRLVQTGLANDNIAIGTIASRMGMSERTFRRRLVEEGTSFRDVTSKARQELCEVYFQQDQMSLSQIAQSLGFQDQSAFSRAFKTWYGVTPRQYRLGLKKPA